jgi:hypothetical protein
VTNTSLPSVPYLSPSGLRERPIAACPFGSCASRIEPEDYGREYLQHFWCTCSFSSCIRFLDFSIRGNDGQSKSPAMGGRKAKRPTLLESRSSDSTLDINTHCKHGRFQRTFEPVVERGTTRLWELVHATQCTLVTPFSDIVRIMLANDHLLIQSQDPPPIPTQCHTLILRTNHQHDSLVTLTSLRCQSSRTKHSLP